MATSQELLRAGAASGAGGASAKKVATTTQPYVAGVYTKKSDNSHINDYNTYANTLNSNLNKAIKALEDRRTAYINEQGSLADAYRKRIQADSDSAIEKSNAEYDNAARQNYINYQRAQKDLPSQLNALGIRGGASESSALRLGTNYGTNVANNESARNTALAALRQSLEQQLADYDKEYRQLLSAYDETYNTNLSNLRTSNDEKLASAYATALANQRAADEKAAANDLSQFAQAIDGQFDTEKGYTDLITSLQKSNDPNKSAKIMLTRQALNKWKEKQAELAEKKASKSGGGGSSYRRSYGGYSSGGGGNTTTTTTNSNSVDYGKIASDLSAVANGILSGTSTKKNTSKTATGVSRANAYDNRTTKSSTRSYSGKSYSKSSKYGTRYTYKK